MTRYGKCLYGESVVPYAECWTAPASLARCALAAWLHALHWCAIGGLVASAVPLGARVGANL